MNAAAGDNGPEKPGFERLLAEIETLKAQRNDLLRELQMCRREVRLLREQIDQLGGNQ